MRKIVAIGPLGNVIENGSSDDLMKHNELLEESFYDFASMLSDEEKAFDCEIKVWPIAFWVSKLLHHVVVLETHLQDDATYIVIAPLEVTESQKDILRRGYPPKEETYCLIQQISDQVFGTKEEMYTKMEEVISDLNELRKRGR